MGIAHCGFESHRPHPHGRPSGRGSGSRCSPQTKNGLISRGRGCSSMVEPQPSKLVVRVRSPSPALMPGRILRLRHRSNRPFVNRAPVAQRTEQEPSKLLVGGSNPSGGASRGSTLGRFGYMVAVAQSGRAPGCDPGCRGFKSRRSPQSMFPRRRRGLAHPTHRAPAPAFGPGIRHQHSAPAFGTGVWRPRLAQPHRSSHRGGMAS